MSSKDFLEYYFKNRNKNGEVNIEDLKRNFNLGDADSVKAVYVFNDGVGEKYYAKAVLTHQEMGAEMLLSRIYRKHGFGAPKYYPCVSSGPYDYAISKSVEDFGVVRANDFYGPMFPGQKQGDVFLRQMTQGSIESSTKFYTFEAIKKNLKMRLLDTASLDTDRHLGNFYYDTIIKDKKIIATGIRPIDFGEAGNAEYNLENGRFYSNFVYRGDKDGATNLTRGEMICHFKTNETVQAFLPRSESSEILGSVDFQKEAEELRQETGYQVDQKLLDIWAKSYDDMAEELAQ